MVDRTRASVAQLLGADPGGIVFGANMTTLNFALTRSIARTLGPDDEIVGTRLDHDANVTPWRLAARDSGAAFTFAPFDPATGRLPVESVVERLGPRTRWLAITGASNALGTIPDLPPIVEAAHAAGAKVLVDAVHLAPHRPIDIAEIGCDALVTSSYKWYGPHAGILWLSPELRAGLEPYKVRPASDTPPESWETGTPSFEAIAGIGAAADFLLEQGMERRRDGRVGGLRPVARPASRPSPGSASTAPRAPTGRTPTAAFTVDGLHPDQVAAALASEQIAVWSGDYYAVEVMASLGLADIRRRHPGRRLPVHRRHRRRAAPGRPREARLTERSDDRGTVPACRRRWRSSQSGPSSQYWWP